MADRKWLEEKKAERGIDVHIWGRCDVDARRQIEEELGIQFDEQIATFIETVGNAGIGGATLLITGSDGADWNCITETRRCRASTSGFPNQFVLIMGGETNCFYNAETGDVECYESVPLNIEPNARLQHFDGFDEFVEWLIDEAALASADPRFDF